MKAETFAAAIFTLVLSALQSRAVTIETVPVGNPGNAADRRYDTTDVGSVPNNFRIGTHEVTNVQYVEFLNGVDPTGANTLAL